MRLVYLSLAWILGVYLGSRFDTPANILFALLVLCTLFIVFFRRKRVFLWIGFCLLLLLGGMFRFYGVPQGSDLQLYRGFCDLRGVVVADPEIKDRTTTLRLEAKEIRADEEWCGTSGIVQIYAPKFPEFAGRDFPYYRYGDLLQIKGMLESPNIPQSEDDFDFAAYLAGQGIYSVMYSPSKIDLLDNGQKPALIEWIYKLRRSMSESLKKALPEPQCSLVLAMLLGERGTISTEVREDFSRAGTSHLLAISGVHVSIVAGLAMSAGAWVFGRKRPTYFLLALTAIWLYVLISGMRPSAIRAATMGSLWLYADWIGRQRSTFTALAFVAAAMLAFTPRLLSDVGFQLSFAAMAGLVFLTPIFQNQGRKIFGGTDGEVSSAANFVIASFSVTLGAVLATLPLITYYFGFISLMSLPATFFTLPAVPGIIISSTLAGFTGILAPAVAAILGWCSWLFANYVLKVVELFAMIPFASVEIDVDTPEVCIYYSALIAMLWLPQNRDYLKGLAPAMKDRLLGMPKTIRTIPAKWIIIPLLVVTILIWTATITASDNRLHAYVLDIGQGDSILIQKKNQQILIDGGPGSKEVISELGSKMPFWDRTIELLVLTHPDSDHITGLIEVLQRYKVQKVLTSGQEHDSDLYREWRKLIEEKEVERIIAVAGQEVIMDGGLSLEILHPNGNMVEKGITDLNSNSVVMRLEYDKFSLLLTGDIGVEAEEFILDRNCKLKSTVLKVAHHGSDTSTSPEFLAQVRPMFAAISAGVDNKFGHPKEEVVKRLEESVGDDGVYVTAEDGTIEFVTDGKKLWVEVTRE